MKAKTVFFCTDCGTETPKWQGRCPGCGAWNTMVEQPKPEAVRPSAGRRTPITGRTASEGVVMAESRAPVKLRDIEAYEEARFSTGLHELDRVLGGGAVAGSLVLVSGEPGIGKSTLLLQICAELGRHFDILYVSGEESARQLRLRAGRLRVDTESLSILPETKLEEIVTVIDRYAPRIVIVDSIQTLYREDLNAAPGQVAQVRECTMALMQLAKQKGITIFVVGHVNKEGAIAGPKVLEHMVDCVLYFEGDRQLSYRILRAAKNRFGSTNEIGVFAMDEDGLREVPNPSEMLLAGRPLYVSGTCVACVMEGTRPVLAEIQALITPTSFGVPRRMVSGIDYNRAMLLLAVLEKRGGLFVGQSDAYINVVGGLKLDEPASDLPTVLAIASSFKDKPVAQDLAALGEVGLAGELRAVSGVERRLAEVRRLGFSRVLIPSQGTKGILPLDGLTILRAKSLREAVALALDG